MEPFLSRDGNILFFNNLNSPSVNTNLYYASKINDTTFKFEGELKGVNTEFLEGVATMDGSGHFYFVSTRSYTETLSSVYTGYFNNNSISDIKLVPGLSKNTAGWLNFDAEVSEDGNYLFTVDGLYDQYGGPYESDIFMAIKTNGVFKKSDDNLFENINTGALEYAACISSDMLEFYFTRLQLPIKESSLSQIFVSTRNSVDEKFGLPYRIKEITGFSEAPTISPDQKKIYYHKNESGKFVLYMIRKE
jgi:hypothetical protein